MQEIVKIDLKKYITDNLLNKNGVINSAITKRDAFLNSDIVKQIIIETSFLDEYNPILADRMNAILKDVKEIKYCICGKRTKLFTPTCGDKLCRNISISQSKLNKLSNNPLIDNDDNINKQKYDKLVEYNNISDIRKDIIDKIETVLIKDNGHINIERVSQLNKTHPELFNNICILTYFCDNHKEIDLLNRVKFLLLGKDKLEFCSCGKLKNLNGERNTMFLPSCGDPKCYYKIVGQASKDQVNEINEFKTKNLLITKEKFRAELNNFMLNIKEFIPIEYNEFRKQVIELYNSSDKSDANILGNSRGYLHFRDNEVITKNLIYYTQYITPNENTLNINQRIYHIINDIKELVKCKNCNEILTDFLSIKIGYRNYCKACYPLVYNVSSYEMKLYEYIKSFNLDIIKSDRSIICPLELDIVIPSKKVAIEINGNYWHSELQERYEKYHINKTNSCKNMGYRLIHIFEDECLFKEKIIKSRIRNILGLTKRSIYARKCIIKELDNTVKDIFLNKYHIQGKDISSIRLGLYYKNRLVAVMTFSKRRFDDKEGYELIRYATIANFNIVGGAGKLLKYFRSNYNKDNLPIISYADKRWSQGNLYKQLGFTLIRESSPSYFYIHSDDYLIRHNRIEFQKHKLKDKLESFDENMSEYENMINNGYTRIWDCGNYVFELK